MNSLEDFVRRTWRGHGHEVFLAPKVGPPQQVCNADVSSQDLIKGGIVCMNLKTYLNEQPSFENEIPRLRKCDLKVFHGEVDSKPPNLYLLDCDRARGFLDREIFNGSVRIP